MHSPGVQAQHEAGLSLPGSSSEEPQKPLALRMSHNLPRDRCKELQSTGQPGQGLLNLNLQHEVLRELVWDIVSLENTASVPSGALGKITPITAPSPEHSGGSWANVEGSLGSLG